LEIEKRVKRLRLAREMWKLVREIVFSHEENTMREE